MSRVPEHASYLEIDFHMKPQAEAHQTKTKDEVLRRLEIPEGYYGFHSVRNFHRSLNHHIEKEEQTVVGMMGLPASGKSTVILQEAGRIKERYPHKSVIVLPWGPYILSLTGGNPSVFGTLNDRQSEFSQGYAEEAKRVIEEKGGVVILDTPGAWRRGDISLAMAVNKFDGYVFAVGADEHLRIEAKEFRKRLGIVETPEELRVLCEAFKINPNAPYTKALVEKMKKGSASHKAIEEVDKEANEAMIQEIRKNTLHRIALPLDSSLSEEELRIILENDPHSRTVAMTDYLELRQQRIGARPSRAVLGINSSLSQIVNFRGDIAEQVVAQYKEGRVVNF